MPGAALGLDRFPVEESFDMERLLLNAKNTASTSEKSHQA
jgi:hypothetical protein